MRLVSANDPAGTQPPGIAIRTKPPSPKRLSRKVLITGCLVFGGVVAFALVNGLSERPDRRAGEDAQSVAAASGPPESVRSASSDYAISDLPNAAELDAPRDMLWGDHPPPEANGAELAAPTDAAWSGGGRRAPCARQRKTRRRWRERLRFCLAWTPRTARHHWLQMDARLADPVRRFWQANAAKGTSVSAPRLRRRVPPTRSWPDR